MVQRAFLPKAVTVWCSGRSSDFPHQLMAFPVSLRTSGAYVSAGLWRGLQQRRLSRILTGFPHRGNDYQMRRQM
jgi:hypothetical protein